MDASKRSMMAIDLQGPLGVTAARARMNDHSAWVVLRAVTGAVSQELVDVCRTDTGPVVALVLGIYRKQPAGCRVSAG